MRRSGRFGVVTLLRADDVEGLQEAVLYAPITVAQHIDAKLRDSRGLEVDVADTQREAPRVAASHG
ncbi:hypothetical protein [uncultured Amnibacterium sp.]|uniref:hypothetical protein n=1 Tax=uncultured Amnibacterium sp. TaxID=1631851 RepID=UPI0035CBAC58